MVKPFFNSSSWSPKDVANIWPVIQDVGHDLGFDFYDAEFHILNSDQMCEMYANIGLPISLPHWRYGREYLTQKNEYIKGKSGLAYEMVINTDPCICYLMESNTSIMTATVIAHASCGHSDVFKNHYLFNKTDAKHIVPFLRYSREYILECEQKYGVDEVENTLNAIMCWENHAVFKTNKPRRKTKGDKCNEIKNWVEEKERLEKLRLDNHLTAEQYELLKLDLDDKIKNLDPEEINKHTPTGYDTENILYFVEKYTKSLSLWQIELVRIIRQINQYFLPQIQTQVINEGWATLADYTIMQELNRRGYLTDGQYVEYLEDHSSVINQYLHLPSYTTVGNAVKGVNLINPYYLGFKTFWELKRVCEQPTKEDEEMFPDYCNTDWKKTLRFAMENYKDESFLLQYFHPNTCQEMKMCGIYTNENIDYYLVEADHSREHFESMKEFLAKNYLSRNGVPQIDIDEVTKEEVVLTIETKDNRDINIPHTEVALEVLEKILLGYKVLVRWEMRKLSIRDWSKLMRQKQEVKESLQYTVSVF